MGILAFLEVAGKVLGAIKGIYDFAVWIGTLGTPVDESAKHPYADALYEIMSFRQELVDASAKILTAIAQISDQIFRNEMVRIYTLMDDADVAADEFSRNGIDGFKIIALDKSTSALDSLLNMIRVNAYPIEAIALPLSEIVSRRIMLLKLLDPTFCTSNSGQKISQAADLLDGLATSLQTTLVAFNHYRSDETTTWESTGDAGDYQSLATRRKVMTFWLSYMNASGTVMFNRDVDTRDADTNYAAIKAEIIDQGNRAVQAGLQADLEAAAVSKWQRIAAASRASLLTCESHLIGMVAGGSSMSKLQRGRYLIDRSSMSFRDAARSHIDRAMVPMEADRDRAAWSVGEALSTANALLDLKLDEAKKEELVAFGKAFGPRAVLAHLLEGAVDTKKS